MKTPIEKSLRDIIRKKYIDGTLNKTRLAAELNITRRTVRKYAKLCKKIEIEYPKKLNDFNFWILKPSQPYQPSKRHIEMIEALPQLIENYSRNKLFPLHLWEDYRKIYIDGFSLTCFTQYFIAWRRKNNICLYSHRRIRSISEEDMAVLQKWRYCFDRKKWERAILILDSFEGKPFLDIAAKIDRPLETVLRWIDRFKECGIEGLIDKPYTLNEERINKVKQKQDNITKLIHESPKLHGVNRTSWRLSDLATAYEKVFSEKISDGCIRENLVKMGYGFKKSREVLTSPDPKFREKVDHIKSILSNLKEHEKFFSVDEYGHFSIKLKGGRTYVKSGEEVAIPQLQKSKGSLLITAALELSSNQITHFYSKEKNTVEMIKLIETLTQQYQSASKLYISWDAAGWHHSKKLKECIIQFNDQDNRIKHKNPMVELAPLPSSAQFLNVIESVFSGMARAIIHNSDYNDVEECKAAIDLYLKERNQHFLEHPKRAGKYLWRLESVKSVFSELNDCKCKPKQPHN
jgi:transposase